jgi:salicylate hydroxylase
VPRSKPLLIGADGLHSPVRAALNGKVAPVLHPSGRLARIDPLRSGRAAGGRGAYGPEGRHLVSYPLRGGTLRNIVAVEERRRWVEEGWSLRDDPIELRLAFESFGPRVRGWLEQVRMSGSGACSAIRSQNAGTDAAGQGVVAIPAMPRIRRCPSWRRARAWGWRMPGRWPRRWMPGTTRWPQPWPAYQRARAPRCAGSSRPPTATPAPITCRACRMIAAPAVAHAALRSGRADAAPGLAIVAL